MKTINKFQNLFPEIITNGIVLLNKNNSYEKFMEKVLKEIKKRDLVQIQDLSRKCCWRQLAFGVS